MSIVRCVDVKKAYTLGERRVEALRGIDLTIDEAGFYAIMGSSGSGKSTLLHLLAALDVPDEGEVHVGGRRIDGLNDKELTAFRRSEVGVVFQQFNLLATMTAAENVELPALLAGESPRAARERAMELLERLGLKERASHRPEALSGGEQQRVAIARALYFSPPVILADEPTGNLDSRSAEGLWTLLGELSERQGVTVIMVTHEPAAAAHCRATYMLQDGRVVGHIDSDGLDASALASEYQRLHRSA
ncbi:MAG: ABC transporter ATP-binding protein [Phycisphaerales bacterium]|nr:ABC transporter ATP-binding protein [Phycisphaerales bacterium]